MDSPQPDLSLFIAGVQLALHNRTGLSVPPLDPQYLPFESDVPPSAANPRIDVALVPGCLADLPPLTRTHTLGPDCIFYRDDSGRLYLRQPVAADVPPVWYGRFDRMALDAEVWIERSRMRSAFGARLATNPLTCGLDQALLIYRLAALGGVLIHGTAVVMNGKGILLAGRSGSGKSTMASLLAGRDRICVLSDERPAMRREGHSLTVYGTPWCSSAGAAACASAPLCGVFFLRHGTKTEAQELTTNESLERILPLVTIPWGDEATLSPLLDVCVALAGVPAFDLVFEPHAGAVDYLEALSPGLP